MEDAGELGDEVGPFDIYETEDGPRHIVNPVRRLILQKMRGCELTVPEIIAATALTKSTISTHLAVLGKWKLVAYREDPVDRRRKRFFLTGRHVATTRRCGDRFPVWSESEAGAAGPTMLSRVLLRSLMAELSCCGLDVGPLVRETGRRVGEMVGRSRPANDIPSWLAQAAAFWTEAGLGSLSVRNEGGFVVTVDDCRLCMETGRARLGLCALTAGVLEGMAAESLRTDVEVTQEPASHNRSETPCGCSFRVRADVPLSRPIQPVAPPPRVDG